MIPIPTSAEIARGVYGAWRLALRDPSGVAFFGTGAEDFWKSFFAAALVAPAYLILMVMELSGQNLAAPLFNIVLLHALAYVVRWTAFPVLSHRAVEIINLDRNYIRFIVAFNWSQVIQILILLPLGVIAYGEFLPDALGQLLPFVALFAVLLYQWYVIRHALDCSGPAAVALVALDFAISIFITYAVLSFTLTPLS